MRKQYIVRTALLVALLAPTAPAAEYLVGISVDGMGSVYVKPMLADGALANLQRLREEGATTLNARTDADYAVTLPNHTSMVTGRGVEGPQGHHWTWNRDPKPGMTLASERGDYTASMFDIAHDHGLSTGLWSGKSKFSVFTTSYNENHGEADKTGEDNGRDKIDYEMVAGGTMSEAITNNFIDRMKDNPVRLAFVHYRDPDTAGHREGWGTKPYRQALKSVDASIGMILKMISNNPRMAGKTAIIITADHGGHGNGHGDMSDLRDYKIPFFVWGPGVGHGDLYQFNPNTRENPGKANVPYEAHNAQTQPIRNGAMGNLALDLLGLEAIPGSTINAKQNLKTRDQGSENQEGNDP